MDSLWDINDMMKDWECMTDLLLEEPGHGEERNNNYHIVGISWFMVCQGSWNSIILCETSIL